jgi:hypothetical protein
MREIMRQLVFGMLLALSILAPGAARADNFTVQDLLQMCNNPEGSPHATYCLGYVGGLGDAMAGIGGALSSLTQRDANFLKGVSTCGATIRAAEVQAFKNWAQAHPEDWTKLAVEGVTVALRETWPCH